MERLEAFVDCEYPNQIGSGVSDMHRPEWSVWMEWYTSRNRMIDGDLL